MSASCLAAPLAAAASGWLLNGYHHPADAGFRTYKSSTEASDLELTPNQRISVLAKKWREERNFWIAAMTFTLWW